MSIQGMIVEHDDGRRERLTFAYHSETQAARIATLERELAAAKSREASPAMLRVVEAAKAWRAPWTCAPTGESGVLIAAVDALAAPAVEKPRYEACQTSAGHWILDRPGTTREQAEADAAHLNAEDAR